MHVYLNHGRVQYGSSWSAWRFSPRFWWGEVVPPCLGRGFGFRGCWVNRSRPERGITWAEGREKWQSSFVVRLGDTLDLVCPMGQNYRMGNLCSELRP